MVSIKENSWILAIIGGIITIIGFALPIATMQQPYFDSIYWLWGLVSIPLVQSLIFNPGDIICIIFGFTILILAIVSIIISILDKKKDFGKTWMVWLLSGILTILFTFRYTLIYFGTPPPGVIAVIPGNGLYFLFIGGALFIIVALLKKL